MFIGELIPGEQYETHDGYIFTLQSVNEFFCGVWEVKRDKYEGAMFVIMRTNDVRKAVKDII